MFIKIIHIRPISEGGSIIREIMSENKLMIKIKGEEGSNIEDFIRGINFREMGEKGEIREDRGGVRFIKDTPLRGFLNIFFSKEGGERTTTRETR